MPPRRGRGALRPAPSTRRSRRGDPSPVPVLPPSQAESPPALQLDLSHGKPLPTSAFRGPTSATGLQHQALSEASSVEEDYLGIGAQTTSASGPAASAVVSSSSTAAAIAAPALTAAVGTADGAGVAAEPEVVADATATAEPAAAGEAAPAAPALKRRRMASPAAAATDATAAVGAAAGAGDAAVPEVVADATASAEPAAAGSPLHQLESREGLAPMGSPLGFYYTPGM